MQNPNNLIDVVANMPLPHRAITPNGEVYQSDLPAGESDVIFARTDSVYYFSTELYGGTVKSLSVVIDATATNSLLDTGCTINLRSGLYDGWEISFNAANAYVEYSNTADNRYLSLTSFSLSWTREFGNVVTATADLSNIRIYVNGVLVYTAALSTGTLLLSSLIPANSTMFIQAKGSVAHLAMWTGTLNATQITDLYDAAVAYPDELSSARLTRTLDDAGWPASWRDIETGVQPVGSYRPASLPVPRYMDQIDNAEQGALFVNREGEVEFRSRTTAEAVSPVGLFDDSGDDLPFANVAVDAHTVDAIRNRVDGQYASGTVTAVDSASVTAYGEASESVDLQLIDDPDDAQSIVDTRLARAKDPRTRVTRLDVNVRRDPAGLVPVVAALDLSDDVTVSLTPTGVGDPLWRAVRVQGITHTVTPQSWDVSLYLAPGPINTNGPLMILDDDTYGVLDSNKLG
jgi:hypothetical protein